MTSIELVKILRKFSAEYGKRVFRLKELAVFAGESSTAAGMALPEKAFLDMVYIRVRKGTFKEMTEVLYPEVLDKRVLQKFARRFPDYVQVAVTDAELWP